MFMLPAIDFVVTRSKKISASPTCCASPTCWSCCPLPPPKKQKSKVSSQASVDQLQLTTPTPIPPIYIWTGTITLGTRGAYKYVVTDHPRECCIACLRLYLEVTSPDNAASHSPIHSCQSYRICARKYNVRNAPYAAGWMLSATCRTQHGASRSANASLDHGCVPAL